MTSLVRTWSIVVVVAAIAVGPIVAEEQPAGTKARRKDAANAAAADRSGAAKQTRRTSKEPGKDGAKSAFTLTDANVVHRQEVYKKVGAVELKVDIFEPKQTGFARPRPAIVFFFGGGWVGGSPSQFHPHCAYLASRGMIALAADYRVKSRHNTTPAECVTDGKSAVRWIRANAQRLGIDPARIAAGGGSAGGHVAAAVATTEGFEDRGEDAAISCRPNALVLFNPVFDNGPTGYGHDRVKEIFPAISPLHNLKRGTPPTIVFLGTKDNLIPVATAEAYRTKMQTNGDRCELHLYEGQAHGFFNYGRAGGEYYQKTLRETDLFLVSLGWLQAPQ